MPKRVENLLLTLLFLAFICAPGFEYWADLDRTPRAAENRNPAPTPEWPKTFAAWTAFTAAAQAYVDDHFGFRDRLLQWNNTFKTALLGVPSSHDVILGKDGWLFLRNDVYARGFKVLEDFRRIDPYSPAELAQARRIFEERAAWSAARGVRYLLVVMPNKETIYAEHMPDYITRIGRHSRLDQLMAELSASETVQALDLRPTLFAAKERERVYDKTGTHWNQRGAFAADRVIARRLARWFPAVRPHSERAARRYSVVTKGGGLAMLLGQRDRFPETQLRLDLTIGHRARVSKNLLVPDYPMFREPFATETGRLELPRAVVFHDSSVLAIRKYLAEHFSRAVYYWQYDFSPSLITPENPDLVLQLIGERSLSNGPPENPPALRAAGAAEGPLSSR